MFVKVNNLSLVDGKKCLKNKSCVKYILFKLA